MAWRLSIPFGTWVLLQLAAVPCLAQQRLTPAESTAVATAGQSIQQRAEAIVGTVPGSWGVAAWSIDRDRQVISINASAALAPASNNKVFTSIWALDVLGPDYRFPTELLITGPIENGVLRGDVVLRGSGDPAFGYPPRAGISVFVEDSMTPLRKMAARLRQLGVRVVDGDVIGDATAFDTLVVGPGWPSDTGGGAAQYAPGVSGLAFQRNMIWLQAVVENGRPGVRLEPPVDVVPVVGELQGSGRMVVSRRVGQDTIRVRGGVSPNRVDRYGVGVARPALLAAAALKLALTEAGIEVRGSAAQGAAPESARPVHRHYSVELAHMIPFLNRDSDNFFAEHLWKATTRAVVGVGSSARGGPASALHFIERAGVTVGELYQFDGSGLSAYNRTSANALVRALVYAHGQPYSDTLHRSMAVAGDRNGSMSRMFRGSTAAGNLHGKTGFINGVRTLSGYVRARNGELIAFAFLYNGSRTTAARSVQEQLGILLAEYEGN